MTEHRDIVAVGASAGGVEALRALVAGLSPDLPAAILVVLHIPRDTPSALPAILTRSGPLPARHASDGEPVRPGRIYIAPNDRHLLLLDGHLRLSRGPAENSHRPAVDPLFRSVARAAGRRAIGVVLSGSRDDGAAGLASIAAAGGVAVIQEPSDALYPGMPEAASSAAAIDHSLPAAKLGSLIAGIVTMELPPDPHETPENPLLDAEVAMSDLAAITTDELSVPPSGYGCPSCGGALFQLHDAPLPRFRCRVGHAWSPESLLDEQAEALESALWIALRALEEKAALSRRMADRQPPQTASSARFRDMAEDAASAGETIRGLIDRLGSSLSGPAPDAR